MKRLISTWLFAACAAACSGDPSTQVVTGSITARDAVTIRAVSNETVVTASRVRSDGSFTLALPAGNQYRLEVLSATGVSRVVDTSAADLTFRVCAATSPFDMGDVGSGSGVTDPPPCKCPPPCDPATDPTCVPCDPTSCVPPPPPCDSTTDPTCPPPCDPQTSDCKPPPCDPATDSDCPPPPCDPTTDPTCPPPCDPQTGDCKPPPGCDPTTDATCPTPPPPCTDPQDPTTCKDPCMDDPATCGCSAPGGWPAPCDGGDCSPEGKLPVAHPPGDFGCTGQGTKPGAPTA